MRLNPLPLVDGHALFILKFFLTVFNVCYLFVCFLTVVILYSAVVFYHLSINLKWGCLTR